MLLGAGEPRLINEVVKSSLSEYFCLFRYSSTVIDKGDVSGSTTATTFCVSGSIISMPFPETIEPSGRTAIFSSACILSRKVSTLSISGGDCFNSAAEVTIGEKNKDNKPTLVNLIKNFFIILIHPFFI